MKTRASKLAAAARYKSKHGERVRKTQATIECKFSRLRVVARRKGVACMSLEEYRTLAQRPCHYCGLELSEFGYGIDRVDCSKGYELANSVPCCTECNIARNDNFTEEEMMLLGEVIRRIKLARRKSANK